MKLSLVVLAAGKQEGKVLEIKVPQFVIGRDPQCHLRPASPMISKRHCALIQKDGKLYIKDFGSTNGSFVNDVPVKNHAELKNGDKLKIGPMLFEVRLEAATVSQPTPASPQAAGKVEAAKSRTKVEAGAAAPGAKTPARPAAKADNPVRTPTPPSEEETDVDDDIAAMLLNSEGETVNDTPSARDDVPQGTTIFELPVPAEPGKEPAKSEKDKDKPKPNTPGNSSSAAAAVLEQMRKRPRASS
jgi:predicted component of type VI protein secretion system